MSSGPNSAATPSPSLARSVCANWAGHMVMLGSGFVLPRLIGDELGQYTLGLWDFAWSMVAMTDLLALGVMSSIARYVARYRAAEDWLALNRVVNAGLLILGVSLVLGFALMVGFVLVTPYLLAATAKPEDILQVQWLVGIMGFTVALELPLRLFSGVLTGWERFDLKNLTRGGCQLLALVAMIGLLLTGYGLIAMAWMLLLSQICTGVLDFALVRWLCPQLKLSPFVVRKVDLKEVLLFGGKTFVQSLSRIMVHRLSGIVIVSFLGAPALAVYARQRALVLMFSRLLEQYGRVFVPRASLMDLQHDRAALRELAVKAARYGFYITLPMVLILAVCGTSVVRLWMGPGYEAPTVLSVLAIGHLPSLAHRGVFRILVGLNRHGLPALAEVTVAVLSLVAVLLAVGWFGSGLIGVAIPVAVAVAIGGGLVPAVSICRATGLGTWEYVRKVLVGPVLAVLPLAASLIVAKLWFVSGGWAELAVGIGGGGLALVPIYWRYALPPSLKDSIAHRLGLRRYADRASAESMTASGGMNRDGTAAGNTRTR